MNIKEAYIELTNKQLNLSDFNDILNFKNECKIQMNQEYLYLADILIIDLYINEGLYDDALNIANKLFNNIDNVVFQKIYISLLERYIYIFIQKQNYKSAYRYAFMKRNFIDLENIDEVNRWYLEMAYIYAELNQKDKALLNLKAILNNYPNDSLRALTLSNMTKLYIDQRQIEEAKQTLNDCITLVYKLEDDEGILYCNYLNAKLSILEKNFKHAKHSFQDFFKNIHELTEDYLSIANEYISLLIEMDLYEEAYRFCVKYLKPFEDTNNLTVKRDFYKNYLKIHVLRNKNIRDDVRDLLKAIDVLEKEIDKYDNQIINESNEDEKRIEIEDQLNKLTQKIEKTINLTLGGLENEGIRNVLINYSKQLEEHLHFDEAVYVIFPIDAFDVLVEVNDNFDKIFTFNYKKNRLYERTISFSNLAGTIVEMIIAQNHEVMLDFTDSVLDIKDIITNTSYKQIGINSLIAVPLFNNKELYGCAIYLSKTNILNNNSLMTNLKVASKFLEGKLINLYYEDNIRTLKTLNNTLGTHLNTGIFYYNLDTKNVILSNKLQEFFGLENRRISLEEFEDFIVPDDKSVRDGIKIKFENVEDYNVEYRVHVDGREYLINEIVYPYISKDGILKFFYGVINILEDAIEIDNEIFKRLTLADFETEFLEILKKAKDLEYKANFLKFRVKMLDEYSANIQVKIYDYVYSKLQKELTPKTYYLDNNEFVAIIEDVDSKTLEKQVKLLLDEFDKGLIENNNHAIFEVKVGVVRFPLDTYNLKEVVEFCNIALDSKERYQPFNEKIHKLYIKKRSISACVSEHITKNQIELLYSPLLHNNDISGYLINYNINGLEDSSNVTTYIDEELLISLERLVFTTLINSFRKPLLNKVYLKLSSKTIMHLVEEKIFSKKDINTYRSIVIIIEDANCKVVEELINYEFGIIINYDSLTSINLETLLNNKFIRGVVLNRELEKTIYDFFRLLNYEIITTKDNLKYNKTKLITKNLDKFSDLFK